ncbi:BTAD domain-containing putative transcriptional regulator [Actinoplanes missouriensis]|uniref:BTAD domain-containing putative transcriptional regulator n=1 Tax=Actinoplanes missouriensis TaxID=1866 RepID=UPI003407F7EE
MMRLRVLGPVEATGASGPIDLGGPRQRAVLALLATRHGEIVSTDHLIDALWRGEPPRKATTSLQTYVSNLRRLLEPHRPPHAPAQLLVSAAPGYRLRLPADAVDAWQFEAAVTAARTAEPAAAWSLLTEALGWWTGPAYAQFADEQWALAEAARLESLRLSAREALADAALLTGRTSDAVTTAEALTRDHPLREEGWRLLAAGLCASGRRAEALTAIRDNREIMRTELGLDPSPRMAALETAILTERPDTPHERRDAGSAQPRTPIRHDRRLRGRARELSSLLSLRERAVDGAGGALVIRGPAGIGKTAVIDQVSAAATDMRVLRATGVEFEVALPYAGLLQLISPLTAHYDRLPGPQRQAIDVAAGRRDGDRPDPAMVGMATLTLLTEHAHDRPLLGLIDDAQWLDPASAQALSFAARRLSAEPVLLLFGVRDTVDGTELPALPSMTLSELTDDDARSLLRDALHGPMEQQVADRILAESRGNPLTLLELSRNSGATTLAGGFGRPASSGASEELFHADLATLPDPTRLLLVIAAAEPLGDPALLWSAARTLGVPTDALAPAEDAGLLTVELRVRFRHPLVRSAAYHGAVTSVRRQVHRALAEATDPTADPDRHAWHRALALTGTDETLAAQLAISAQRVRTRGGLAAAAAFLEHAARLTPDPQRRRERILTAATDRLEAGAPADAVQLLTTVDPAGIDAVSQARMELLRGRAAFAQQRGRDAAAPLRRAAALLEPLNPAVARQVHLDALTAATAVGELGGVALDEAISFARTAVHPSDPPTTADLLLDGMVAVLGGDHDNGLGLLRRAVAQSTDDDWPPRVKFAAAVMWELWDLGACEGILDRQIERARAVGNLTRLPDAFATMAGVYLRQGRFPEAASVLEQGAELAEITGSAPGYPHLALAAWSGDPRTVAMFDATVADATARGEGLFVAYAHFALAVHHNSRADYQAAVDAAVFADRHLDFGFRGIALRELVEAAARAGDPKTAEAAYERLRRRTRAAGTDFAAGVEACCAALIGLGDDTETHFMTALEALGRSGMHADRARAELLYGEWLRREGRRSDARRRLQAAHTALLDMGAEGFARRAARELAATGDRARTRSPRTESQLTAQELTIARLVAGGATSREVSAELFVSPRTVDAHLRHIFRKLDITSRRQLRGMPLNRAQPGFT